MQDSPLPRARQRLDRLLAVTTLRPAEADPKNPRMQFDQNAPANWVAVIHMADPLSLAESCSDVLEGALYSGIPRNLDDIAPADGFLPLLDAVIEEIRQSTIYLNFTNTAPNGKTRPRSPVFLSRSVGDSTTTRSQRRIKD